MQAAWVELGEATSGGVSMETLGLRGADLALLKAALPAPASADGPRSPGTSSRASSKAASGRARSARRYVFQAVVNQRGALAAACVPGAFAEGLSESSRPCVEGQRQVRPPVGAPKVATAL